MFEVTEGSSVSIEDQTFHKRLRKLAGKKVILAEDLDKRVRAAVDHEIIRISSSLLGKMPKHR